MYVSKRGISQRMKKKKKKEDEPKDEPSWLQRRVVSGRARRAQIQEKGDPPARGGPSALVRETKWSAENEKEIKRKDKPEGQRSSTSQK
jgi:hypothetical protein